MTPHNCSHTFASLCERANLSQVKIENCSATPIIKCQNTTLTRKSKTCKSLKLSVIISPKLTKHTKKSPFAKLNDHEGTSCLGFQPFLLVEISGIEPLTS